MPNKRKTSIEKGEVKKKQRRSHAEKESASEHSPSEREEEDLMLVQSFAETGDESSPFDPSVPSFTPEWVLSMIEKHAKENEGVSLLLKYR